MRGLSRASARSLHRQLYEELREAILSRRLRSGTRLPSTRELAAELKISRNTVMSAFEQLLAEGYLEGKVGSGTYVASRLPDDILCIRAQPVAASARPRQRMGVSRRGTLMRLEHPGPAEIASRPRAFRTGVPALEEFPLDLWARVVSRAWRGARRELLSYGQHAGHSGLRKAIADYLREARGVRCEADQVIIVEGTQQGLDMIARLMLDPGDAVWMENPGYYGAWGAFRAAGARVVAVPVDAEGLDVDEGIRRMESARLAYVTPSHQWPLGAVMTLRRRLALLDWASRARAWIVEDDYDSEYRYSGRPLAAIQGLDRDGHVLYAGSFSKVLVPSLRLGYIVVPGALVDDCIAARRLISYHAPTVEQAALAEFIADGHFARHIRRMRTIYAERQQVLIEESRRRLAGLLDVEPQEAGLALVGWLPEGVDDIAAARRAAEAGVDVAALSRSAIEPLGRGGLVLGYAVASPREIREGVRRLEAALGGGGLRRTG
ncbi:MAG: PLP-dependent aminotransferase family protein [Bryobacteraceae bacterium]